MFMYFTIYICMAVILFSGAKPFEQIANIVSTEGLMLQLVKIVQAVSEKNMLKDVTILYMYIDKW